MANVEYTFTVPAPSPFQAAVDHMELEYSVDGGTTWTMDNANVAPPAPGNEYTHLFAGLPNGQVELSTRNVDADGDKSSRLILTHSAADVVPPASTSPSAQNV